jgi:hypothetical protein
MPVRFPRLAAIGLSTLSFSTAVWAQAPQKAEPVVPASASVPAAAPVRVIAYIHGSVPVTREELGDFLIARGGYEKAEKLINRKIIEMACAERKITVSPQEMEAVLSDDMKGLGVQRDQFIEQLLAKYNHTYYEWMEDVIKPRLMLKKLVQDQVKVDEADLKKQYEAIYGEKRRVQMVMWPKDQVKVAQEQFAQARKSQEEYDRVARGQANPSLAASAGHVLPISLHQSEKDPLVEKIAFELKVGEISQIIEVQGQNAYLMLKLHEILPPDSKMTFEKAKPELEKAAFDKKVEAAIPDYFKKLKEDAKVSEIMVGPPAEWKLEKQGRK